MVTSWYFKNICYAQQGLLCVPVCHNLDRKGEEAEIATAISLLTYSNTFNIKQKVSNRQRAEKCRINTQLGPHTKALLQPQSYNAVKRQGGEQRPLWGEVHCDPAVITSVEASSPGSLLPTPGVAEGKCFHKEKLILLCLLGMEAPSCGTPTPVHTYIDISQPQTVVFLHLLLFVSGRNRTWGLESITPFTGDLQIWLHYTSHSIHCRCWEKDGCYTYAFLQKLNFSLFFPSMAPQDPYYLYNMTLSAALWRSSVVLVSAACTMWQRQGKYCCHNS